MAVAWRPHCEAKQYDDHIKRGTSKSSRTAIVRARAVRNDQGYEDDWTGYSERRSSMGCAYDKAQALSARFAAWQGRAAVGGEFGDAHLWQTFGDAHLWQGDAVLVDTFLTVEQSQTLLDWIVESGKNLTAIYIPHGHGDHFFGLSSLLERFPHAKAVATPEIVKAMHEHISPDKIENFWRRLFPGEIADCL